MNQIFAKIIYFIFTLFIFVALWKITGILWNAYVPWNTATDLLALLLVIPTLIAVSFILSSVSFKVIRCD